MPLFPRASLAQVFAVQMNTACVFSIDNEYVMPFQVFFHSLEETRSIPDHVSLYILHTEDLDNLSISLLDAFLARYGRSVTFLDATHVVPRDLPIRPGDHVSPATFYRLFIADILPSDIDQAVYFDADMLALSSVRSLFAQPVNGLVAASDHLAPSNELRLWGDQGGSYFQAGVLLIPLQIWRQQRLVQRFLRIMSTEHDRIQWWDQDVLNIALRDQWERLPIWFNVCEAVHQVLPLSLIEQHAAIIHYSGSRKPWNSLKPSPFTDHWDRAYAATFSIPFDRAPFLPSRYLRLKAAVRSRISGLIHGR